MRMEIEDKIYAALGVSRDPAADAPAETAGDAPMAEVVAA